MGLSQSMRQEQEQSLRQEIRLSQSQSLQLQQSMRNIRERFFTPSDDSKVIDMLASKLSSTIQDDNLKQIIALFLADKKAKEMMSQKAMMLSIPKKQNLNLFIYQYLFQSMMEVERQNTVDTTDAFMERDERFFIKAFTDREFLEHEAKVGEDMVKLTNANVSREYKTAKKSLNLVDQQMIDYAKQLSQILEFILLTKIKKEEMTEEGILEFLREKTILDHIQEFSSERLLRRFLTKLPAFAKHREIADRRRFKESMINIIGEFMLISLGIISPEMFTLKKFFLDQNTIDALTLSTESTQDEVFNLFRYYNLRGINGQPIFYNRRYTQNQVPSREADELVKDFLQKLRLHQDEVFQAFGFNEFISEVIDAKRDRNMDHEEKNDAIIDNINNRFGSENFLKAMTKILVNYRYKDTYALINPKKKTR